MIGKKLLLTAGAPLALALVLSTSSTSLAQHRGGGGGGHPSGGGTMHSGGGSFSRGGGWGGGYGSGYYGGYRGWEGNRGYGWNNGWRGDGWRGDGFGWGLGLGLGAAYLYDNWRPGVWVNSYDYPGYYSYYGDDGYSGDNIYYGMPSMAYSSSPYMYDDYGSAYYNDADMNQQQQDSRAYVRIRVPTPDTKLKIEGQDMSDQGLLREYRSPPLQVGRNFTYEIQAQWTENGQPKNQTRKFPVHPGDHVMIVFGDQNRQNRTRGAGPINERGRDLDRTIDRSSYQEKDPELNRNVDQNRNGINRSDINRSDADKIPAPERTRDQNKSQTDQNKKDTKDQDQTNNPDKKSSPPDR